MKLSVVIPALNEEATIARIIERIPKTLPGFSEIYVIVIDDGSSDKTPDLAHECGAMVISHFRNTGVGAAFQSGVNKSIELCVDFMVNIDADGQCDPKDIPTLLKPLIDGEAECATASRFIQKELHPKMHPVKYYGNKLMALLISVLTKKRYYDVSCGFRAYTRNALLNLNLIGDFTYTQETFLNLSFKGITIKEVPLKIRGTREHGNSRVASNLLKYGVRAGSIILRALRDYKPFMVFSLISGILLIFSAALFIFLSIHFFNTGTMFPHKWSAFAGAVFLIFSLMTFLAGIGADMLDRIRLNQERILYLLRKNGK